MKPRRKSKTYALNLTAVALAALEAKLGLLQPVLGPQAFVILSIGVPVANLIVREFTRDALAPLRPGKAP